MRMILGEQINAYHLCEKFSYCRIQITFPEPFPFIFPISKTKSFPFIFFCICKTCCRTGVVVKPSENAFIFEHSLTINFSRTGNIRLWFLQLQKLLMFFRDTSSSVISFLKTISCLSTLSFSFLSFATISSIASHSVNFILVSLTILFAVEDPIRFNNLSQLLTSKDFK